MLGSSTVADNVGVAFRETESLGWVETGVHASHDNDFATKSVLLHHITRKVPCRREGEVPLGELGDVVTVGSFELGGGGHDEYLTETGSGDAEWG